MPGGLKLCYSGCSGCCKSRFPLDWNLPPLRRSHPPEPLLRQWLATCEVSRTNQPFPRIDQAADDFACLFVPRREGSEAAWCSAKHEDFEVNQPQPRPRVPRQSLVRWLIRYGLIGAVAAPLVAMGVAPFGKLTADALYLSPLLGLLIGSACGIVGWAVSKV